MPMVFCATLYLLLRHTAALRYVQIHSSAGTAVPGKLPGKLLIYLHACKHVKMKVRLKLSASGRSESFHIEPSVALFDSKTQFQ